jgi:uncharacterized RDD family membrane protein YckC
MIDFFILLCYLILMKFLLYDVLNVSQIESIGMDILIISLPMLLYSVVMETTMNGQTIGKKIMSIRVVSLEGGEPTLGQFLIRWITRFFEWPFFFGYIVLYDFSTIFTYMRVTGFLGVFVVIIISVTRKNQRLGDLAAGTVVVDAKTNMDVNDTVFMEVNEQNYQVKFPEVMRLTDSDINTINTVLLQSRKSHNYDICLRVESKVKEVLGIQSNLHTTDFLEKLLEDYNYLATKE